MLQVKNEFKHKLSNLNRKEQIQIFISSMTGLGLCVLASAIVNSVLVEISISYVFAAYFGFCFILIGVLLMMRIKSLPENSQLQLKKPFLLIFSCLVLFSGGICFFLERDWQITQYPEITRNKFLTPQEKIPFYIILAISLNFTLIFSLLDMLNFTIGLFQRSWQRTMVETPNQIVCVMIMSTIMGCLYGLLFSVMDIEDIKSFRKLERKLIKEEHLCMPIAALLGFIGGAINEILRISGNFTNFKFETVNDPFQEEI